MSADTDWDDKRYVFRIGAPSHDEPERLTRSVRKRGSMGTLYPFCEDHWSWTCFPQRAVSSDEARSWLEERP